MKEKISKLLRPPVFEEDLERTRRAEILHYITIAIFSFSAFMLLVNPIVQWVSSPFFLWLISGVAATQVLVQWMIRSRYVNHASLFLLSLVWALITLINRIEGGVRDTGMLGYVLVLLGSAILLGWRMTTVYALASILVVWWLAWLEITGQLTPNLGTPVQIAIILTLLFALILVVVYFLLRALTTALDKAQHELTERIRMDRELERLARTDSLTGLYNRRHFMHVAESEFAASIRYGRPLSVIILDIDFFKRVNDAHGHQVGDHALTQLGAMLRGQVREADTPARYGGEEFIVLLSETSLVGAKVFAERLRGLIAASAVKHGEISIQFTVSIGVAERQGPESISTLERLISRADQALYKAKDAGRNCVVCATDD